jgi:uncharacterized membrane protein
MALTVRQTTAGQAWIARPNRALSQPQARRLVMAAAAVTFLIAFAFSAFGAWPVLPFAGIEIGALWLALRHLQQHANDEERIDVGPEHIVVTRLIAGCREEHRFARYWAQLRLEPLQDSRAIRLTLRSHGRELEIGRLLTDPQKLSLIAELKTRLGPQPAAHGRRDNSPTEEGT